jgi:hypothetical protein
MTPEEKHIIFKLTCVIFKSCYDPKTLRKHGILGDIKKYNGCKNAMMFISELLQEMVEEKKELPTMDEAKIMLKESQKQNRQYQEFINNILKNKDNNKRNYRTRND